MSVRFHGYKSNFLKSICLSTIKPQPGLLDTNNALCVNLATTENRGFEFTGGLYTSCGNYIDASGLVTNKKTILGKHDGPLIKPAYNLPGNSLYLGLINPHYGHFLLETLTRLWPFNAQQLKRFDHVIVLPADNTIPEFANELFKILGIHERIHIARKPFTVDHVCVPEPAIRYPHKVHRSIINIQHLFEGHTAKETTDQPLFISRTGTVPGYSRTIIGDELIKQNLLDSDAVIFYPEQYSILEQVRILRRHKTIIGFAGSALHTLLISGGSKKIFAYSERNVPDVFPLIDKVLKNTTVYIKTKNYLAGEVFKPKIGFEPQIIDAAPVLKILHKAGIITHIDLRDYGTPESNKALLRKYNTAKLLRLIVEKATYGDSEACQKEIDAYKSRFDIDTNLVDRAARSSCLINQIFKCENTHF